MFIIYAILIFCLLIVVHEFGHFISAKLCGVKVNEFALGMGPTLLKKQGKETLYVLKAFPIGGYCAMEGEDESSEDPKAFNNKSAWQKAIIVVAGSLMNFLLAILIISIMNFMVGEPTTTIKTVVSGSPAQEAGLKKGDTILKLEDFKTNDFETLNTLIIHSGGEEISLLVRDEIGRERTITVDPELSGDGSSHIGIEPTMSHSFMTFLKSFPRGVMGAFNMTGKMYGALGKLFTGQVSLREVSGPVGIVKVIGESASLGFLYILNITALISLNLAIVNMLPFPALDGGRLLFLIVRKIFPKRISDKIEGKIHMIGLLVLFGLMILITFSDIAKLIIK